MKGSLVLALVLAAAACPRGNPPPDPCGNPILVSQGYAAYSGTVTEVLDPVTLLVSVPRPPAGFEPMAGCSEGPCKVRLVNLDAPSEPGLAASAKRNLLAILGKSRRVNLSISPVQDTPSVINALVAPEDYRRTGWLSGVNKAQLEAGLATYRSFGPYAVDWYIECELQRAQDRAREGRRGVWSAPK